MTKFKSLILMCGILLFLTGCTSTSINLNPLNEEGTAVQTELLGVELWDNINNTNNDNITHSLPVTLISNTNTTLLMTQPDPLLFRIGRGSIPNSGPIFIVGDNTAVGNVAETIWNVGGLYPWLENESFINISSTDTDDTILGTGARQILLIGLDINYVEIVDVVDLSGTGVGTSNIKFFRINDAVVFTAGSTKSAEGTIDLRSNSKILGRIEGKKNRIQQLVYTAPVNKTLFTGKFVMNCGRSDEVQVQAWSRTGKNGLFYISSVSYLYQNILDFTNFNIFGIPGTTDIEVRGINAAVSGSSKIAGILEFSLISNDELDKFNIDFPLNR